MYNKEELEQVKKIDGIPYNHEIVGVIEEGKRYYFDPLHGLFIENYGTIDDEIIKTKSRNVLKAKDSDAYYIESYISFVLNKKYRDQLYKFLNSDPRPITDEELEIALSKTYQKLLDNNKMIREFCVSNQQLIKEISDILSVLAPSSEEKMPEWVLKKTLQN